MRRIGTLLPIALGAVALIWLATLSYAALDLMRCYGQAQELAGAPREADLDVVDGLVRDVRRNVTRLRRGLGWLFPAASRMGWVPGVGPLVAQMPPGLVLADVLTEFGVSLWIDLRPTVARYQQGASTQSLIPEVALAFARDLEARQALVDEAVAACRELDVSVLPRQMADPLAQSCDWMPLLRDALPAAEALPALLGLDEPQTYLALALNEDELRPGGGFITAVGEVSVSQGRVVAMEFRDSYAVDDFSLPYPDPPEPLREFMAVDLLVLRDSNWSPDFPTSAQRAIDLYRPGYPVEVSGVIGLDQIGVTMLFEALEPLTLPGADRPVTSEDLLDYIHAAWAPEDGEIDGDWWLQRKSFMADVAGAALDRVQSGDVDLSALAAVTLSALEQRHLQIYVVDDTMARFLAEQNWDGGMVKTSGDYLMPVEANLGYNKASTSIRRSLSYELDLRQPVPYARATLGFEHLSDQDVACAPEIRYDVVYADMMHRCYWAYVRLAVPADALFLSGTETFIPAENLVGGRPWDGGVRLSRVEDYAAFGQGFLLPTREEQALDFAYQLPQDLVQPLESGGLRYHLYIQKQPGVSELDVNVTLHLPDNAVVFGTHPEGSVVRDGVFFFETVSSTDVEIALDYRLKEW